MKDLCELGISPYPWHWDAPDYSCAMVWEHELKDKRKGVCGVSGDEQHQLANLRLIAAAPELYEALTIARKLLYTLRENGDYSEKAIDEALAAMERPLTDAGGWDGDE